ALDGLVAVGVARQCYDLRHPGLAPERLVEELGRVGLDHDLRLEVQAGGEPEVFVARTSVTVVADDAVGDEIAGTGCDVVEGPGAYGLERPHEQAAVRADRAVVRGEAFVLCHEPPTALGQKPVLRARQQLDAAFEGYVVTRRFDGPVVEHRRADVTPPSRFP